MLNIQHNNTSVGGLVAVVAILSALVVVTAITQMYAVTVALILAQLVCLGFMGHRYAKARELRSEMFCANLTVSK